jgi:hypothetical protein
LDDRRADSRDRFAHETAHYRAIAKAIKLQPQ